MHSIITIIMMEMVVRFLVLAFAAVIVVTEDFVTLQFRGDHDFVRSVAMYRAEAPLVLPPRSVAIINLGCPAGRVALGGGCRAHEDDPYYVTLRSSYPGQNYTRWFCEWTNMSERSRAPDLPKTIYVLCGIANLDEDMCSFDRNSRGGGSWKTTHV